MTKKLLTVREAASFLDVHFMTIYKWCYERKIPFIRIRGSIRLDPEALDAWVREGEVKIQG